LQKGQLHAIYYQEPILFGPELLSSRFFVSFADQKLSLLHIERSGKGRQGGNGNEGGATVTVLVIRRVQKYTDGLKRERK
jgi:hypothetical protein